MNKAKLAISLGICSLVAIFLFINSSSAQTASISDAIGVRIIPNPNHYSIYRWYDSQGFKGSPQALSVDGYEAVRDGRTVYVNAANVKGKQIYTNIYLISYNQDPSPKTVDILGQIVKFWKFNEGLNEGTVPATCAISSLPCLADTDCSTDQFCATSSVALNSCQLKTPKNCSTDDQCPQNFFCTSVKSKIVRDISRIGRTEELKEALFSYKSANGSYPRLAAGSYLSGNSVSVWPSWTETFLPALTKTTNLIDPINRLGACTGYDVKTCWNKDTKRFVYAPTPTYLMLPAGSYGFVYKTDANGSNYNLCAVMETREATSLLNYQFAPNNPSSSACVTATGIISGGTGANTAPRIVDIYLAGEADQEFNGSISAVDDQDNPITWTFSPGGSWTTYNTWGGQPALKSTSNPNQKKVYSIRAGAPGSYPINLSLSDGLGGTLTTSTPIVITNSKPFVEADNGEYTLNPSAPLIYSFYYSDNNLATPPTSAYTLTKLSGPAYDILAGFSKSVTAAGTNRYQVSISGTIPTANKFLVDTDYMYRITVRDKYGAATTKDFKLTIKVDAPALTFNCPVSQRVGSPYSCFLGNIKQGVHDITFSSTNLPAGLSIKLATTTDPIVVYGAYLNGTSTLAEIKNITIKATNEYGASSTKSFSLNINNYCGDGAKQIPNSEGRGGMYNDGYEDCDITSGLALVSGKPSAALSSIYLQYGCTTIDKNTPFPIPTNNYCIFKSPVDGGGYCGDGYCQLKVITGSVTNLVENSSNCSQDCNPSCTPNCGANVCGTDGCGGSCGTCTSGNVCTNGKCINGCGDGVCSPGETISSCAVDCVMGCCLRPTPCSQFYQYDCSSHSYCHWIHVTQNECTPKSSADCWDYKTAASCTSATANAGCEWNTSQPSSSCAGSVSLDTTPPTIMSFILPPTSSSLTVSITSFTAADASGIAGYLVTESASKPLANSGSWSTSAWTYFTFASAGTKTLYAWAKDAAGNVSNSLSRSITVSVAPGTSTYYISPSGNDSSGNGSILTPWKSLYKACTSVTKSGDTIHVKRGNYSETQQCNLAVGVSIEGEGQENTIINSTYSFSVSPSGDFFKGSIVLYSVGFNTPGNQTISNLSLDGGWTPTSTNTTTATRGINIRGRGNVTLNRITVKNFWVNGIGFYAGYPFSQPTTRSNGNVLMYSTVRNNGNGYWTYGGAYEGGAGVEVYGQSNLLVHHNTIMNTDRNDRNSDLMARFDFSTGVKMYNNEFWKTEMEGPNNLWNFGLETWNIQGGVEIYDNNFHGGYIPIDLGGPINTKGAYDYSVKVYRNTIVRATAVDASEGAAAAIHLESSQEMSDVFIYDNYIENFAQALSISDGAANVTSHKSRIYFYNNRAINCQWQQTWTMNIVGVSNREGNGSTISDLHIENNTFTGKAGKSQYGIDIFAIGTLSNIFIKNNIFYQLNNANSQGFVHMPSTKGTAPNIYNTGTRSNIHIENNLTYLTGNNNNVSYSGTIGSYTNTNQIKANPLFISTTDFHLRSTSPAINAGINVGLPYSGSAPDIGAFESSY